MDALFERFEEMFDQIFSARGLADMQNFGGDGGLDYLWDKLKTIPTLRGPADPP